MSEIKFNCPHCGLPLALIEASAGVAFTCPKCGKTIQVPQLAQMTQPPPSAEMPSRAKGWWLAGLGALALALLVAGLLLWQRHLRPGASFARARLSAPDLPENLASNLVLYFNFDAEPIAGKVPDLSGHGNNGQAVNVQWVADGHRGGALVLSPTDSHIRVPNNESLNPPQFTLHAWIKTSRTDQYWRRIFDKGLFHKDFSLSVAGDWKKWDPPSRNRGFIEFEMPKGGESRSRHSVADGKWHQIAATYDGQDKRLFIDGELQGKTHCPDVSLGNDLDLVIGGFTDPDPKNDDPHASFDGSLDDVMMFNRALSPDEVQALYASQKTASDAGDEPAAVSAQEPPAIGAQEPAAISAQAALTVVTNFEGASARVLALDPATQTIRITPAGNVDRGWPCWWYFRLNGVEVTRPLVLQVLASTPIVTWEGGTRQKRLGADWSLPAQAAISTNGVDWDQSPFGERRGNEITYRIQPGATNLWLAWGPPFTLSNAWSFVRDAARDHSCAKYFTLATSLENRPVPGLQVSEGDLPESRRPAIWVQARQHAWEVGSSWVGIGFAKWLLSQDPRATQLRSEAEIFIVPIMDGDRVSTGDGGKQSIPQDHNEDWSDTPHYTEVAAVEKRILDLVKENRMSLLVDLHDPNARSRNSGLWVTPTNFLGALAIQNQEQFIRAGIQEIQLPLPLTTNLIWDGPGKQIWWQTAWHHLTCPWVYEHGNPQTVAVTLEVAWNAPASTISGYFSVGEGLGRAIELYLRETASSKTSAGLSGTSGMAPGSDTATNDER